MQAITGVIFATIMAKSTKYGHKKYILFKYSIQQQVTVYGSKFSHKLYFFKILTISGINPVILFGSQFHLVNPIKKLHDVYIAHLHLFNRLTSRSLLSSTSASIDQRPTNPRAAEPDVPPSKPKHTLKNVFCTFSNFDNFIRLSVHNF